MPRPKSNRESDSVRRMVHQHLQHGRAASPAALAPVGKHLDEDALSAFVEGRLSHLESAPLVGHLVGCDSCRNITAQLIRLDTELSGVETEAPPPVEERGRIRALLTGLAARVLPLTDGDVVFAYHAPADDFEKKENLGEQTEAGNEEREQD